MGFMSALLLLPTLALAWVDSPAAREEAAKKLRGVAVHPRVYTLDLDAPMATRWDHITKDFKSKAPAVIDYFNSAVPKWAVPLLEAVGKHIEPYFREYGAEMMSVADGMGLPRGAVVLLNLVMQIEELGVNCSNWNETGPTRRDDPGCTSVDPTQEWCYCHAAHRAGAIDAKTRVATIFRRRPASERDEGEGEPHGLCTSVVAQDASGTIVHGRNLDWNLPPAVRELVVDLDVVRGGRKLFRATGAVGVAGTLNGLRYADPAANGGAGAGAWSVSIDARGKGGKVLTNLLQALLVHSMTPTQHMRRVLEQTSGGFEEAVRQLSATPQIDENYFIVAGSQAGEGAVIARGREKAVDVWRLDPSAANGWYRLQTNYDHWNPVPTADDRRHPGYKLMDAMGPKGVSPAAMWGVITTWPVFNGHTDFSLVAVPAAALYNSTVWMGGSH